MGGVLEFALPSGVWREFAALLVDDPPELLVSEFIDQELHASAGSILFLAQAGKDAGDSLREGQHFISGDKLAVELCLLGNCSEPAANVHLETLDPSPVSFLYDGNGPNVVDHRETARFVIAAREGNLEFASEVLRVGAAQQKVGHRQRMGGDIKTLRRAETGIGASGDVANHVAAGFTGRDPHFGQPAHDVGGFFELNEVELDVLTRGDVADAVCVLLGQIRQADHLFRGQDAERNLDSQHLDAALALPVNPVPQAGLEEDFR